MTDYSRAYVPGTSWFFTVNLAERHNNPLLIEHIEQLRAAFRYVKQRHPYRLSPISLSPIGRYLKALI
jgi:putative transposase